MNWLIFAIGATCGAILALTLVLFTLQSDYKDDHQ